MSHPLRQPPRLPLIFPSILGADFMRMGDECAQVLSLGADGLHVDVMDGHFVPNLTMGPRMVEQLRARFPDVYLDVHLMVTDPEDFVDPFAGAGANCLSFHIEASAGRDEWHERAMIERIRDAGCDVGIVINPPTNAGAIDHVIGDVDMVLVMSVNPGFAGQSFIPAVLEKCRRYRAMMPPAVRLEIDGGIGPDTVAAAREAGCDVLVTASALFGAKDRAAVMRKMRGN